MKYVNIYIEVIIIKVLSTQEPYASLIANGYKSIETRSWCTKYRGDILIHASQGKKFLKSINNYEVLRIIDEMEMMYGNIVCIASLTDCIYMDDNFVNKIKNCHQEHILGIYENGRYAWILENVRILNKPIKAKGKLNLWEYDFKEEENEIKLFEK